MRNYIILFLIALTRIVKVSNMSRQTPIVSHHTFSHQQLNVPATKTFAFIAGMSFIYLGIQFIQLYNSSNFIDFYIHSVMRKKQQHKLDTFKKMFTVTFLTGILSFSGLFFQLRNRK